MEIIHGGTAVAVDILIVDDDGDVIDRQRQTFTVQKLEVENFAQLHELIMQFKAQVEENYATERRDT